MDSFDGRCRLYVWLCQIAKNTYFTYAKRRKHRAAAPDTVLPDAAPNPEGALLDKERAWALHQLLHALEEPYKEVFSLRVFGELSFSQIGQLFGRSDSWARLIFYRAKARLRRCANENEL